MRLVTPSLDGDLLTVLARADRSFTGRELARAVGSSSEGARQALARLVEQGIVTRETAGSALMYRLNRQHLAAGLLASLVDVRAELIRRLAARLDEWDPAPAYAALFGSVARGDDDVTSDLDLVLVRPVAVDFDDAAWRTQVEALERDATSWTGNDARALELGEADLAELGAQGEASVLDDVLRDGVRLAGDEGLLRRARRGRRGPHHE